MTNRIRVLTGITTTGTPHLGNYVGAIRPAITLSRAADTDAFFFLADYHALIKCDEPERIARSRLEIAATWLAAGLDPERVTFYRQSDIPEIPELTWLLTCVTAKGLMNRAHAYKAAVDANLAAGEDADAGIAMGLYSYPILMAADILLFNAQRVPVGRDQVQHIEMARDVAARFNHVFGAGRGFFVLPEAAVEEQVATLPGLDGRKMSKSYDNTIPLFVGGAVALKDAIARIVTDSRAPGEPKDIEGSHLYAIHRAFTTGEESAALAKDLRAGLAWGEAKQRLFARVDAELAPLRERYEELIARPGDLEDILQDGARKARAIAAPFLAELRTAVGLRPLGSVQRDGATVAAIGGTHQRSPVLKQYREDDRYYFKLAEGDDVLVHSMGFLDGRTANEVWQSLQNCVRQNGFYTEDLDATRVVLYRAPLGEEPRGVLGFVPLRAGQTVAGAVARLREAMAALERARAEKQTNIPKR